MHVQIRVLNIKDFILIWYNSSVYGGGYVMEAIEVSHLTFSYDGKNDILKDVSFQSQKEAIQRLLDIMVLVRVQWQN